jgi:hypothetical protein
MATKLMPRIQTAAATMTRIDPAMAAEMLRKNTQNRPLRAKLVQRYAAAIARGEWAENGSTIVFGTDGRVLDGQHRLAAVIEARKAIDTLVVRGVSAEVYATIDTGKSRTGGDAIHAIIDSPSLAAATIRFLNDHATEWIRTPATTLSNTQILERALAILPQLRAAVEFTASKKWRRMLPPSVVAGLFILFAQKDRTLAEAFFTSLADGEDLKKRDPVFVLRERFIAQTRGIRRMAMRVTPKIEAAWVIKAWNLVRLGKDSTPGLLTYSATRDRFPVVQ